MPNAQLHNADTQVEPTPTFASDAEVALAEQLRHQLEEQYLGTSAASSRSQAQSDQGH
jgi:hypothetical protein